MINNLNDTIVAISTPKGKGGIGIIRLSGSRAYIISKVITKKKLIDRNIKYTNFFDEKNIILDNGLVLFFKKPRSFTGDDVVEFHVHGNDLILNSIIIRIIKLGARMAEPGEFSFRAYINNKIDILQAISINTLINSKNISNNKLILNTLLGNLSKEIKFIINDILLLRCEIESSIDFPDDVKFNTKNLIQNINFIKKKLTILLKKIKLDTNMNEDIKIIIVGDTNVGKSSFFNWMLKKDRAIITDAAGTTRDFLEDTIMLNNKIFHIIDTAGLNKKSYCKIEKNGILKTFEQMKNANIMLFMFDVTSLNITEHEKIVNIIINKFKKTKKILILKNKIDVLHSKHTIIKHKTYTEHCISVKKKIGLAEVLNDIKNIYNNTRSYHYSINKQHFNYLLKSKNELITINLYLKNNNELVFIAEKLKTTYLLLKQSIGENTSDIMLEKIFSTFCIGK